MTVGERIRDLRTKKGMTPPQLAKAAGVTSSAITQLENGDTKAPSFENGLRIAQALGVSPYELAFGRARAPIAAATEDEIADLRARVEALERRQIRQTKR